MWFGGEHSSVELMAGLDDLRGLFQPKQFYDPSAPSSSVVFSKRLV